MIGKLEKLWHAFLAPFVDMRSYCAGRWIHFRNYVSFKLQNFQKCFWDTMPVELSGLPYHLYLSYHEDSESDIPLCYLRKDEKLFPIRFTPEPEFLFAAPAGLSDDEKQLVFAWLRKRVRYYLRHYIWFPVNIDKRIGLFSASKRDQWKAAIDEWFGTLEVKQLSIEEVLALRDKIEPTFRMRLYTCLAYGRELLSFLFKVDDGYELTLVQASLEKGLPYSVEGVSRTWNRGLLAPSLKVHYHGRLHQIVICDGPYFRFGKPQSMPEENAQLLFQWVRRYHDVLIGLWHVCDESGISSTEFWHAVDDAQGIEWSSKLKPVG